MLELLLLAMFSSEVEDFSLQHAGTDVLPTLEILEPAATPIQDPSRIAPKLMENPSTAVIAVDLGTGKVLFEKESQRSQPIASITKLMTALIILENHDLDEVVTVPLEATQVVGASAELYAYEQLSVRTLLQAILIPSANDAALALASHHAGTEQDFVKKMNIRARELGLGSAQFFNVTGLDVSVLLEEIDEDIPESYRIRGNTMSAYDVMTLARFLLRYDFVRETVKQDHFYGTSVEEDFFHEKPSTNQLLGTFLNIQGLKTGYTALAGECFVALGKTSTGNEVLTVILGSPDRFGETKKLLSWVYDAFMWR